MKGFSPYFIGKAKAGQGPASDSCPLAWSEPKCWGELFSAPVLKPGTAEALLYKTKEEKKEKVIFTIYVAVQHPDQT